MATSEKEYLAWINLGVMGTCWRSNTIKEAVETCAVIAAQDWGGLRGRKVSVAVYDVTGVSVALMHEAAWEAAEHWNSGEWKSVATGKRH